MKDFPIILLSYSSTASAKRMDGWMDGNGGEGGMIDEVCIYSSNGSLPVVLMCCAILLLQVTEHLNGLSDKSMSYYECYYAFFFAFLFSAVWICV